MYRPWRVFWMMFLLWTPKHPQPEARNPRIVVETQGRYKSPNISQARADSIFVWLRFIERSRHASCLKKLTGTYALWLYVILCCSLEDVLSLAPGEVVVQ